MVPGPRVMSALPVKTEQCPEMPRAAGSFRKLLLPPELHVCRLLSPRGSVHLGQDTAASPQRVQGQQLLPTPCVRGLSLTCHRPPAPGVRGGVPGPGLPSREEGRCCKTKGNLDQDSVSQPQTTSPFSFQDSLLFFQESRAAAFTGSGRAVVDTARWHPGARSMPAAGSMAGGTLS